MSTRLSSLTVAKLLVGVIACCDNPTIFLQIADDGWLQIYIKVTLLKDYALIIRR